MLGWRGTGSLLMLVLGCGETTHGGAPPPAGGNAPGGDLTGGTSTTVGGMTSGSAAGGQSGHGATQPQPDPEMGGSPGAGTAGVSNLGGEGGDGEEPCHGIRPRCEPGEEACDPILGKLGTCGACGVVTNVDKAGIDCVRLLASDKESNGVCVVLGSDRLECWPDSQIQKTKLPPDIVEVLLPDDYPPGSHDEACFRDSRGGYSCFPEACDGRVVVGDTGMCGLCHGEVLCHDVFGEPPSVPQPLDISLTDGYVFVLNPLGVHAFADASLPSEWRGAPAQLLVDHQSGGCAMSNQRELACWLTLGEGLRPATWQGRFKKVIGTTLPRACALDDARQLRCGNVFEDATPTPYGDADTIDFAASNSIVCSLSVAGHVKCWNDMTGEPRNLAPGW